ncbi:MAG: hypothetical protein RLZZ165_664 [Bacteroidota bacterium]
MRSEMKLLDDLLQLLFSRNCPGCDRPLVRGEREVCSECLLELEETKFHERPKDNELYYRLAGKVPCDGAAALFYFYKRGRLKRITTAFKYGNRPQVARFLGEYFGDRLQSAPFLRELDWIVPVPLHRSRLAQRGYNQSEMIARGLSRSTGVPVNTRALGRVIKTSTQTRKSQSERWENVKEAFEVRHPIQGTIALVDDVVTTGATLEACIRQLYAQPVPPTGVYVLILGMAGHR